MTTPSPQTELATTGRRQAPGPAKGSLIREFKQEPLGLFVRLAREYGSIVRYRTGLNDSYLITDPQLAREVLVKNHHRYMKAAGYQEIKMFMGESLLTSDGDYHKRHRRMTQPIMHHSRMVAYTDVMADYAARARDRWQAGQTLHLHHEMLRLTLDIVAKALYGLDFEEARGTDLARAFWTLSHVFTRQRPARVVAQDAEVVDAAVTLNQIIDAIIEERRTTRAHREDLLSMLLAASDEDGILTDQEVRDETIGLMVAGHETTAGALTWTFWLLAHHPEVERKVLEEVETVLGGARPTFEDFGRLKYTHQVFLEALRLYPSAWTMSRQSIVDHELGGYFIPAGSTLFVSQYVVHRDSRWWPEPDRFLPDRWVDGDEGARRQYTYFPFGGGLRLCIGESFAEMEAVFVMATLLRAWRLEPAPDAQPEPPLALVTIRPRDGMPMIVRSRE
jgi:cytochrome P450